MIHKILNKMISDLNIDFIDSGDLNIEKEHHQFQNTPFFMAETLAAVVGAQGLVLSELWALKTGRRQKVTINGEEAAINLTSFLHQRQNGFPVHFPDPIYPSVGFYQCQDGRWIFLNGGYPHLRNILLKILDCSNDVNAIEKSVSQWDSFILEETIAAQEGCGDVLRSRDEWLQHPQGMFLKDHPPIVIESLGKSNPKPLHAGDKRPLSGIRVLDLTHVIAGPTCARSLSEHGADVLHIPAPHLPSIFPFVIDTGHGKRNAHLDLREEIHREHLKELIKTADIFIQGYQPGKIASFGFSPEEVAKINPHIIYVTLSCFGDGGPWGRRPGFEQLGQTVSGMAFEYSKNMTKPSLVPAFPCDYITGYLGALGTMMALYRRSTQGGSYHVHISLTKSAMFVMDQGSCIPEKDSLTWPEEQHVKPYMIHSQGPYGDIHHLRPMVGLSETHPRWDLPPSPFGAHKPIWLERPLGSLKPKDNQLNKENIKLLSLGPPK